MKAESPGIAISRVVRRAVQAVFCIVLNCSCSSAMPDDKRADTLRVAYPSYSVRPEVFAGTCPRVELADVGPCILDGDFNGDGHSDFAAILRREISDEELAAFPDRHRDKIKYVDLAVVCNGAEDAQYACRAITEPVIGGLPSVLEMAPWATVQDDEDSLSLTGRCEPLVASAPGIPLLTLTEPNGLCRSFVYESSEGIYERCTICGD